MMSSCGTCDHTHTHHVAITPQMSTQEEEEDEKIQITALE